MGLKFYAPTDLSEIEATLGDIQVDVSEILEEVNEIERHLHNWERWFGEAVVPNAPTHVADRIGTAVTPFTADAGNNTWGSWVQILGSTDTPADTGMVSFDLHRLQVVATERFNNEHYIQIGFGASGAAALAAGTYTEVVMNPQSAQGRDAPMDILQRRVDAGELAWFRVFVPTQNTGEIDFYFGLHEYPE